jgi:hypothetical protein
MCGSSTRPRRPSEGVLRRLEWALVVGFVLAMLAAGLAGSRAGPDAGLLDPRPSTLLTGPRGVSALAEAIERLGVAVERRRIPLFGLSSDLARAGERGALVLIEPTFDLMAEERREVVELVLGGGTVVLVGRTGVERDLGILVRRLTGANDDSLEVSPPAGIGDLPGVRWVIGRSAVRADQTRPVILRIDTLVAATNGRPVAFYLRLGGGGQALLIAESGWVTNRSLRDTDVGALIVPWILALNVERAVVDEHHHGFGRSGALFGAAWRWLWAGPPGWAMLQLAFAGLVALWASVFRFGPAVHPIPRRRRSPLEHVDTLGSGLERARGHATAVRLLGQGLQRRLRAAGRVGRPRADGAGRAEWLATLSRSTDDPGARDAIGRLGVLLQDGGRGKDRVLRTAQAVEDVWEALKRPSGPATS